MKMKKEQRRIATIVTGISKDIQFKGMKHVDARTEAEKAQRSPHVKPYYRLVNKATGKNIMSLVD